MAVEISLWSYVAQWFGYVAWCASAADAACRPFVGFLALFGASAGALTLLLLGMRTALAGLQREIHEVREPVMASRPTAAIPERTREPVRERAPRRPEPAIGARVPASLVVHAEPLLAAAAALPLEAERALSTPATAPVLNLPLRPTL